MHNGARAFEAAGEACRKFRAGGGIVVLLSNAPRPFSAVVGQMASLGVDPAAYDGGVTSGDATRGLIEAWAGKPLLHIGPERDLGLFDGLGAKLATAEEAEAIVCSGLLRRHQRDAGGLRGALRASGRAPPADDLRQSGPGGGAGRQARLLRRRSGGGLRGEGWRGHYAGKPYLPIYERTLATIDRIKGSHVPKARVLAIGDGVDTDLLGAHRAGLRSVFIASAVHLPDGLDERALAELFAPRPFRPIAALPALVW